MNFILKLIPRSLLQGTLSKLIRHLLAAFSGWLTGQGLEPGSSVSSLLAAGAFLGVSLVWSWLSKGRPLDGETKDLVKQGLSVLVAQLIAAFSGWLMQHGYEGNANDPVGVGVFFGNWLLSIMDRKDAVSTVKVIAIAALLALVSLPATACARVRSGSVVDDASAVRGVISGIPATWVCVPVRNGRSYHWRACLGSDGATAAKIFLGPQGR